MEDYHIRDIKELYQFYVRRLVQENIEVGFKVIIHYI